MKRGGEGALEKGCWEKWLKKTLVESISNELTGLYPTFLAKSGSNTDLSRNFSAAFTTARKIHPDCSFRYFDIVH